MKAEARAAVIPVECVGPLAARFLATHDTATVAAVFERSVYLERGGDFLCLGEAGIGDGPINAVAGGSAATWVAATTAGDTIDIRDSVLHSPTWQAGFAGARRWQPSLWPGTASARHLVPALLCVEAIAASALPSDGIAPLILRAAAAREAATAFARVALPRLVRLEAWLRGALDHAPPIDLLGLGPGLTPSGDDALCGALLALDALGASDVRDALAAAALEAAPRATTPLSAAFLAAAADGLGSAALHDFIAALVAADIDALPATIHSLGRIGHTSGWDALTGAWMAISAHAAACPAPRFP